MADGGAEGHAVVPLVDGDDRVHDRESGEGNATEVAEIHDAYDLGVGREFIAGDLADDKGIKGTWIYGLDAYGLGSGQLKGVVFATASTVRPGVMSLRAMSSPA